MPNNTDEKKSERIEIRVSHSKKRAFNAACEAQGDTSSGAMRRFIDSYIMRADHDALNAGLRAMGRLARRQWAPIGVMASMLLVGGYFTGKALKPAAVDGPILTASTDNFPAIQYALFEAYDKNANGVLDLGEVSSNDEHLHRVLNLDGEAGIAPAEFYPKATMQWQFVKTGSVDTAGTSDPDTAVTVTNDGPSTVVEFDLTDTAAPMIATRAPRKTLETETEKAGKRFFGLISYKTQSKTHTIERTERVISWERGRSRPVLSFSNHDFRERWRKTP